MPIGELCSRKVTVVHRDDNVMTAARLMREQHVGDVVVVEEQGDSHRPVGILTDRDIVLELVAKGIDLNEVTVGDAMSFDLFTLPRDMDLLEAVAEMRSRAVRRVPIVDEQGQLAGILSLDDLLGILAELIVDLNCLVTKGRRREL